MGISIDNNYSSYYTQQYVNNYENGINKAQTGSISTMDKTSVDNANTKDKTITQGEYFKELCAKYTDINLNMSNSYSSSNGDGVTFNVSPEFINKAINDPATAEALNGLLDKASETAQYINDNNYSLDGGEVKDANFLVDKDGEISCKYDFAKGNSTNAGKTTSNYNGINTDFSTVERFPNDCKIQVAVSVTYLVEAKYDRSKATALDSLLDSLEEQISTMSDFNDDLGKILTGTESKSAKVVIDGNGKCSCTVDFGKLYDESTSKSDDDESLEEQVQERNEKVDAAKEAQEKDLDAITERKLAYYYNV